MKTRIALEEAGEKILNETRTELYLSMHYMGAALDLLGWKMDLSTFWAGTDGSFIRYNPQYLIQTFLNDPKSLPRLYLHMIMHCLLLHPFQEDIEDRITWNLSCDLAVEHIIDSIENCPPISRTVHDFRVEWYERLAEAVHVLTAEKIYRYFTENPLDFDTEDRLRNEFLMDDHSFWEKLEDQKDDDNKRNQNAPPDEMTDPGEQSLEEWKTKAERMLAYLDSFGKEISTETGTLRRILAVQAGKKISYRDYLRRFAVVREEARVDLDSFDYGFYNYGMELYGNMPLIEENEYREARKIEELVIVVDTSASCQADLVERFLTETAAVLAEQETFFHRINLHIIECDDKVQKVLVIHDPDEMRKYLDSFEVLGGYGTDFRPAFAYVDDLQARGELKYLRGLIYFTDGYGIYPETARSYETAFVFPREDMSERPVPPWAVRLYLAND